MQRMSRVNEWLLCVSDTLQSQGAGLAYHQQSPDCIVKEDRSGYDQHSKTEELVQLLHHQ